MKKTHPTILVILDQADLDSVEMAKRPVVNRSIQLAKALSASVHLFFSVYRSDYGKDLSELSPKKQINEAHAVSLANLQIGKVVLALENNDIQTHATVNFKRPAEDMLERLNYTLNPILLVAPRAPATNLERLTQHDYQSRLTDMSRVPVVFVSDTPIPLRPSNKIWAAVDVPENPRWKGLNDAIVQQALTLARKNNSEVHLMHCFNSAANLAKMAFAVAGSSHPLSTDQQQQIADNHMQELVQLASAHDIPLKHIHNLPGVAQVVLPIMAARTRPLFIVMGAHNQHRLKQFIFGSTTKRLLHRISGAICVVKPPSTSQTQTEKLASNN